MFISLKEYFIINNSFKTMKVKFEADLISQEKKEVIRFKDGNKEVLNGQVLEIKPDNYPGKTLTAKVFNQTEKFEKFKRYEFSGDLSFATRGQITYINFEVEKATLIK